MKVYNQHTKSILVRLPPINIWNDARPGTLEVQVQH